jgi:hypothetical protein
VKEFRLRGISTYEAAGASAPSFIADFNRRFGKSPRGENGVALPRTITLRMGGDH